jgi:hypothetical protein
LDQLGRLALGYFVVGGAERWLPVAGAVAPAMGGPVAPFVGIKLIDMAIAALGLT